MPLIVLFSLVALEIAGGQQNIFVALAAPLCHIHLPSLLFLFLTQGVDKSPKSS